MPELHLLSNPPLALSIFINWNVLRNVLGANEVIPKRLQ